MSGLELEAHFLNGTLTRSPGNRAEQLPLSAGLKSVGFMSLPTGNTFLLPLTVKAEFWVRLEHPFCSNIDDAVIKRQAVSSYVVVPASGPSGILLASRLRDHCCPLKVFAVSSIAGIRSHLSLFLAKDSRRTIKGRCPGGL